MKPWAKEQANKYLALSLQRYLSDILYAVFIKCIINVMYFNKHFFIISIRSISTI